ncbi:MAG: AraC family transcriptional regulator [Poseidonibacter sp.]|uniref:AraC family transcriptional regulator n=1 Tax=Poseidonibacter sp. TaxID=2321188 RepID=UPI00359ECD33
MNKKTNNRIFKIPELPYLELKYSNTFFECSQKHYHNMLCILGLKKGSAKIMINDEQIVLRENKLVIINPNEVHYSILDEITQDYYVVYIDRTWYQNLQKHIFKIEQLISLPNEIVDLDICSSFFDLFEYLYENNDVIEKELKLFEFLKHILNNAFFDNKVLEVNKTTQIAKEFKEYIENNISSKLTLTQISNALGYSPYHIIRICNQNFGLSANAYIVNKRVHRAKKLICDGIDISQAAREVGFYDQSHLTNVFKKVFALTPKAYQNDIQNSITRESNNE